MTTRTTRNRVQRFVAMTGDAELVARRLLGQRLVRVQDGVRLAGTIVETEAYLGPEDRAAHTFGGRRSTRNESMYGKPGTAYVYFTYGMHHCLNVVCGRSGEGVAVLIRALEPTEGLDAMHKNCRRARRDVDLCRGPGRVAEALALTRVHDGLDLLTSDDLFIEVIRSRALPRTRVVSSPRIGLNLKSTWVLEHQQWLDRPLRYALRDCVYVSRRQ